MYCNILFLTLMVPFKFALPNSEGRAVPTSPHILRACALSEAYQAVHQMQEARRMRTSQSSRSLGTPSTHYAHPLSTHEDSSVAKADLRELSEREGNNSHAAFGVRKLHILVLGNDDTMQIPQSLQLLEAQSDHPVSPQLSKSESIFIDRRYPIAPPSSHTVKSLHALPTCRMTAAVHCASESAAHCPFTRSPYQMMPQVQQDTLRTSNFLLEASTEAPGSLLQLKDPDVPM